VQTPRRWGEPCNAGLAVLYLGAVRPFLTSWLNVGKPDSSKPSENSRILAQAFPGRCGNWPQDALNAPNQTSATQVILRRAVLLNSMN
jgi:hypothetical protein